MKSLRKTVWMAGALFLSAPFARLDAQTTGQGVPPATREQSSPAPAQQGGPTTIRIPVNQVIVPVTVKDGTGRLVPDLRRDEFRVFEDNVEQKIVSFIAEPIAISMVVLIDNDLNSRDARQVEQSLRAIVAGLSLTDEAWVCRFDQRFHPGKGFLSDQDKLLIELKGRLWAEQPSAASSSPAIANGPSINGISATGAALTRTDPTLSTQ